MKPSYTAAILTIATLLLAAPIAAQPILNVDGAGLIELIEIGKTTGVIGHKNNAVLQIGDSTDDEVQIRAGTADRISFFVNQNLCALDINWNGDVGIGTAPAVAPLHIYRFVDSDTPFVFLDQDFDTRDAAIAFRLNRSSSNRLYTLGIDQSDGQNFKILAYAQDGVLPFNTFGELSGPGTYADPNMVMRIHSEVASGQLPGIVDLNHQSRARWSLSFPQIVPQAVWTPIEFDFDPLLMAPDHFDEHLESVPGAPGAPWTFVAQEEGYYQVNARTEYLNLRSEPVRPGLAALAPSPGPAGGFSIAIFKIDVTGANAMHSQGNNLQFYQLLLTIPEPTELRLEGNNAPNVSDVVHLRAGEAVQIFAWWDAGFIGPWTAELGVGPAKTYVSVHKLS